MNDLSPLSRRGESFQKALNNLIRRRKERGGLVERTVKAVAQMTLRECFREGQPWGSLEDVAPRFKAAWRRTDCWPAWDACPGPSGSTTDVRVWQRSAIERLADLAEETS